MMVSHAGACLRACLRCGGCRPFIHLRNARGGPLRQRAGQNIACATACCAADARKLCQAVCCRYDRT
eukprot:6212981-Pleurochrysis_carterae.AAC.7